MYVSALVMIKEKVVKNINTEVTNWFAVWNDDRKFHHIAGSSHPLFVLSGFHG